jgi:cytochrome c oxidase cbb3-type subunit 3/ubiquinol-cytochrome c reductase cytochrome c subunit
VNRVVVVLGLVAFAACQSGDATPAPSPTAAVVVARDASVIDADVSRLAGKPLYAALCAPCHGVDAKGYAADHAPSLVNPTFLESASDDFLRRGIAAGRPGTSMAAYSKAVGGPLDDAGVDRLVGYLREQGPPVRSLPAPAAGDVAAGSATYAKRCFGCHGDATSRGEGISLANPQFQAAASDAFVRHAIVNGRPGTKMESFASQLTDAEIDGVVSYVRTLGRGGAAQVALLPPPTGSEPLVINPSGKSPSFQLRAEPCPPGDASCKPEPRFVSVEQVAKAVAAHQRMVIIDARPPSEWMRVHIAGAVSIPYHDMKRLAEVPKDGTWIIAYCACPHHLSGIVVDELRKRGYTHAVVLDEGINDWHRRGFPVTAAAGVTKPAAEPVPPR